MNVEKNQSESQATTQKSQPVFQESVSSSTDHIKIGKLPQSLREIFPSAGNLANSAMLIVLVAILVAIVSPDFRGAIGIRITSSGFEFNMDRH